MDIHLSDDEAGALTALLDSALGELSEEIAGTDNAAFRATLRRRRDHLVAVRHKLDS